MAWGFWGRRRRWRRWRARRRRWRPRRRRRRRPARRFRARRRVRRRGGRWRRRYRKWRRGRRRRTHKKKIIIKQWQPNFIRRCYIIGYLPLIFCGENTTAQNYATHSDDMISKGPYGGGMTTTKLTLRILYDEFTRFMNFWTVSNEDLDLCRYVGCKLIFFKHPTVDFIVQINTQPPFLDTHLTAASIHPGIMMLSKRRILIPSLKTRPSRKHRVVVRVGAPRLFQDKWYPQSDLCDTVLLSIFATACDLQYPFGSPLTDNPCVSFQILGPQYKKHLSISSTMDENNEQHYNDNLFNKTELYNTFQTIAQLKETGQLANISPNWNNVQNSTVLNKQGDNAPQSKDTWYKGNTYNSQICALAKHTRERFKAATKGALPNYPTIMSTDLYEYHSGIYSSIFLSAGRSYFETTGAYSDIIYNPFTDKGTGNIIWIDYLTKEDTIFVKNKSKCEIMDMPLWAACTGYTEFCAKYTGDSAIIYNARVLIRCPYTEPMLVDHSDPNIGFVPYSFNFGNGKMPGGSSNVPIRMRAKWYVNIFHQKEVLESIVQSGPFGYRGDIKSAVLAMKYRFHWKWGGNPISKQVVRNPCSNSSSSAAHRGPRSVQAVDPKYNTPEVTWHSWDIRRGLFGKAGIKRMQQESDALYIPPGPLKRPRRDTNAQDPQEQNESSGFRVQQRLPWIHSSQETQSSEEETQAQGSVQDQLLLQLREQRVLRLQLQQLATQVLKVQAGHGLHPLLSSQA
uniref:Capsid protein n=1 Tax=Alphatorquevirus homin3 TaxID=3048428 RepID=A0AAU8H4T6_9VIRU